MPCRCDFNGAFKIIYLVGKRKPTGNILLGFALWNLRVHKKINLDFQESGHPDGKARKRRIAGYLYLRETGHVVQLRLINPNPL